MDPFALQDEARRNTGRLVALAVIAVVAVVAAAAFVFACGAWIIDGFLIEKKLALFSSFIASPAVIAISLLVSILIVLIGFLVKMDDLASAESLMKSVGAERIYRSKIHGNDNDSLARLRLFNVCEEMSISSGVSMPSVWVLPKSLDVNAFVAGESPETSAICVTDCALRYLERDELQGLVAHAGGCSACSGLAPARPSRVAPAGASGFREAAAAAGRAAAGWRSSFSSTSGRRFCCGSSGRSACFSRGSSSARSRASANILRTPRPRSSLAIPRPSPGPCGFRLLSTAVGQRSAPGETTSRTCSLTRATGFSSQRTHRSPIASRAYLRRSRQRKASSWPGSTAYAPSASAPTRIESPRARSRRCA